MRISTLFGQTNHSQNKICPKPKIIRSNIEIRRPISSWPGLTTSLVVSVHSIVSLDFAVGIVPGWHSTIMPYYIVAGALLSGFSMGLTLITPVRHFQADDRHQPCRCTRIHHRHLHGLVGPRSFRCCCSCAALCMNAFPFSCTLGGRGFSFSGRINLQVISCNRVILDSLSLGMTDAFLKERAHSCIYK